MWQIYQTVYTWTKWNIDNLLNYGVGLNTFILLPTPFQAWKLKQIANGSFFFLLFTLFLFLFVFVSLWYGFNICFCLISHVRNKAINQSITYCLSVTTSAGTVTDCGAYKAINVYCEIKIARIWAFIFRYVHTCTTYIEYSCTFYMIITISITI